MRLADHLLPARCIFAGETELREIAQQHFGIEDAHDDLLAEGRRQARDAQLDLLAARRARLDASVLRLALLGHVEPAEDLQAAGHRRHHRRRNLIDLVQHAVDAKADVAAFAPRLQVDVARALFERVLQQPVDDADHVLIVGRELAAAPELGELLEVLHAARREASALVGRSLHRARKRIELDDVAIELGGVGEHALDLALEQRGELALPFLPVRLGSGDDDLGRADLERQDARARRVGVRHQLGDAGDVERQRIDALPGQAAALGQPAHEPIEREPQRRLGRQRPVALGDDLQRMPSLRRLLAQRLRGRSVDEPVGDERVEQLAEVEAVIAGGGGRGGLVHRITLASGLKF